MCSAPSLQGRPVIVLTAQLEADGLKSALDVARLDLAMVRRRWSVVLKRTVRELQGQPCGELEAVNAAKKEIARTRSFGSTVQDLAGLVESVTDFASPAAEKLRKQQGRAGQVLVFIHTSPFRKQDKQYSNTPSVPLRRPTADTGLIADSAIRGLKAIFRPGYRYAKAGVMLLDLQDVKVDQGELDLDEQGVDRSSLMTTIDAINERHGRGAVLLASAGTTGAAQPWVMKQSLRTPSYTTSWKELPVGRAN